MGLGIITKKDLYCGHWSHGTDCRQRDHKPAKFPRECIAKKTCLYFGYKATFELLRRVFSQTSTSSMVERTMELEEVPEV